MRTLQAALVVRNGQCCLLYLDEARSAYLRLFRAVGHHLVCPMRLSPIEPDHHCRYIVVAALNFDENGIVHTSTGRTFKGPDIVGFADLLISNGDARAAVFMTENASIHYSIDRATLDRLFMERKILPFYSQTCMPRHNIII